MRLTAEKTKKVNVPNDPDSGYVVIRALSRDELAHSESASSSVNIGGEVSVIVDPYKRANLIATSCLKGWGNFFDSYGNEIKFNNKSLQTVKDMSVVIEDKPVRFFEWVKDEHDKFFNEVEEEKKVALKN